MKYAALKFLDVPYILGAIWNVAKADTSDKEPGISEVGSPAFPVGKLNAPKRLIMNPFSRCTLLP
jgi:hypothetical protein